MQLEITRQVFKNNLAVMIEEIAQSMKRKSFDTEYQQSP